jgi:hypothetical protein
MTVTRRVRYEELLCIWFDHGRKGRVRAKHGLDGRIAESSFRLTLRTLRYKTMGDKRQAGMSRPSLKRQ